MSGNVISRRLSGKLLLMTVAFVMLAEMVIFIPSAALFRHNWLAERAERAGHITLALMGVPNYEGSAMLSDQFMADTDIVLLSTRHEGMTELVLGFPPESDKIDVIDMRGDAARPDYAKTFAAYFGSDDGYLRVHADPRVDGHEALEFIVPKVSLQEDLRAYSRRIFWLSAIIALIVGMGLYLALRAMIVRPIQRLAKQLAMFREDPERRRANPDPSGRADEIGQLEREFFDMKKSVRASFKQRERLATLGLAVAKINHDLRNVLTSAQLVSDRLAMDKEERVANMGQRLVRAIDRGVRLCADVLNYSSSDDEADPQQIQTLALSPMLDEVAEDVLPTFGTGIRHIKFRNDVPADLMVRADADHTYRIFNNLFRNAAQAMAGMKEDMAERCLCVSAEQKAEMAVIYIRDTGPGLPPKVRDNIFQPFAAKSGNGNTGLGLSISQDLAKSQGGALKLAETGPEGTVFEIHFSKTELDPG